VCGKPSLCNCRTGTSRQEHKVSVFLLFRYSLTVCLHTAARGHILNYLYATKLHNNLNGCIHFLVQYSHVRPVNQPTLTVVALGLTNFRSTWHGLYIAEIITAHINLYNVRVYRIGYGIGDQGFVSR
jgi:hypothetical protein